MKKKFFPILIFAAVILAAFAFYFAVRSQMSPVSDDDSLPKVKFEVPFGTSAKKVALSLKEQNLIKNEKLFYSVIKYPVLLKVFFPSSQAVSSELKSGTYYLSPAMDYGELLSILTSGRQEYIHISIPEGLTISKIAAILEQNKICPKDDFIASCKNKAILSAYEIPSENCEGFLFPDTYFLNSGMDSDSVVRIMLDNFYEKLNTIPKTQGLSAAQIYELVTLSSIVEREYRIPEEAPLIASVFKNRLKQNIGLYSCATIEYIITEIQGKDHPKKILIEDTKIDSPYNTYKWAGLPPGPISNPGLIALTACADTPSTNYYYFQIVDPSQGRHIFTTTFDQHVSSHNLYTK